MVKEKTEFEPTSVSEPTEPTESTEKKEYLESKKKYWEDVRPKIILCLNKGSSYDVRGEDVNVLKSRFDALEKIELDLDRAINYPDHSPVNDFGYYRTIFNEVEEIVRSMEWIENFNINRVKKILTRYYRLVGYDDDLDKKYFKFMHIPSHFKNGELVDHQQYAIDLDLHELTIVGEKMMTKIHKVKDDLGTLSDSLDIDNDFNVLMTKFYAYLIDIETKLSRIGYQDEISTYDRGK